MNLLQERAPLISEPLEGNYFVAAYPPFSAWKAAHAPELLAQLRAEHESVPLGLYVHVPFCQRKCDYCYYLSYVQQSAGALDNYVNSLVTELELYREHSMLANQKLNYIYFGGGTPSLLTPNQLRKLSNAMQNTFLHDIEEFTFECAPRTVRPPFLEVLKEIGVTRVSMGVQSLDDQLLKLSGRIHLAQDAIRAFEKLRSSGCDYINLDFMVGLPGETDASWKSTITKALELSPESITIYQTEIPHNTRLYRELASRQLPAPVISWPEKRRRLEQAWIELQKVGYEMQSAYHAVKNPAKQPFRYQQYLWGGGDLLCLGVASFGYFQGVHYQNECTLQQYQQKLAARELPIGRAFRLSEHDRFVRNFILQLKLGEVNLKQFEAKYKMSPRETFSAPLRHLQSEGLLKVTPFHIKLTTSGLLQVDRLLPLFYDAEYRNVRYT